jgi:hypothetical protein
MTETSFTPGRWFAMGCDVKPLGDKPYICWTGTPEREKGEARANACLIASAPELYDVLQKAMGFIEAELENRELSVMSDDAPYIAVPRSILHQIDNVLRKARGEGGF